jgi:hypothetical protein
MSTLKVSNIQNGSATNVAMVLDTAGTVKAYSTISVGNVTPSSSGAGITFPATQSASTDANTLDDYEEGDFTATVTPNAGGSITLNSSINTLSYTKVGRVVTVCGWIQVSSVSSPSGTYLEIGGLPFALANLTEDGRCAASVTYLDDSAGSYTVMPTWGQELTTKMLVFQTQNTIAASDAWVVNFSYFAS